MVWSWCVLAFGVSDRLSYRVLYGISYHRSSQGEYAESRRLYRSCVELDPRDGRGWLGLARHMQKIHK